MCQMQIPEYLSWWMYPTEELLSFTEILRTSEASFSYGTCTVWQVIPVIFLSEEA